MSGVGPISSPADTEEMMRTNRVISSLARRSEMAVYPLTALLTQVSRRRPEQAMKSMAKRLPPADVAVVERPEVRAAFIADARNASGTAARAAAQDMALFARPWGFELSQITVPVDFWQADEDRNVPASHARSQSEQVKGSQLRVIAGEGHFMVFDHLEEILRTAVA